MAEDAKLTLIVPKQLHEKIVVRAKAEGQTVAGYIRSVVLADLKSEIDSARKKDTAK